MKSLSLVFSLWHSLAFADFYLEPNAGVGMGSNSASISGVAYNENITAPTGGVRLGYFSDYFFIGPDIKLSSLSSSGGSNLLYTGGLGMSFTREYIPLRVLLSLDFMNTTQYRNVDFSSFGYRFGFGYYVTENIIVNLEYQAISYSKTVGTTTQSSNIRNYYVTVSFPFTFDYPTVPWRERYRATQGPSSSTEERGKSKQQEEDTFNPSLDSDLEL